MDFHEGLKRNSGRITTVYNAGAEVSEQLSLCPSRQKRLWMDVRMLMDSPVVQCSSRVLAAPDFDHEQREE